MSVGKTGVWAIVELQITPLMLCDRNFTKHRDSLDPWVAVGKDRVDPMKARPCALPFVRYACVCLRPLNDALGVSYTLHR